MVILLQLLETWSSTHMQSHCNLTHFIQFNLYYWKWGFTLAHLRKTFLCFLSRNPNLNQRWNFYGNLYLKVKVYINCPSRFNLLKFRNKNVKMHMLPEYLRTSRAVSPCEMPPPWCQTDAISRLQISFTTVEAGDFPNGLRCNRQILCIRVCHSEHHQIS